MNDARRKLITIIIACFFVILIGIPESGFADSSYSKEYERQFIENAKMNFNQNDKNADFSSRMKAVNISRDTALKLSTQTLWELVEAYPFSFLILAYDDCDTGFDTMAENFEVLPVFMERKDAPRILQAYYDTVVNKDGYYKERALCEILAKRMNITLEGISRSIRYRSYVYTPYIGVSHRQYISSLPF